MKYKIKILNILFWLILLSFVFFSNIYAQSVIFITSDPYKADVIFNGQVVGKTPCLITNVSNGVHKIVIKKENFQSYVEDLKIEKEGVYKVSSFLIPIYFSFFVPSTYYVVNSSGVKVESPFIVNYITNGFYKINLTNKKVEIKKINFFTYGKWVTLGTGLVAIGSSFLVKTDQNDVNQVDNIKNIYLTKGILIGSGVISLIFSAIFFVFDFNTKNMNIDISFVPYQYKESESELYAKAMFYLNSLKYDEAISYLNQFFETYPDSKYISDVIYYIAYIYEIKEDFERALKFYLMLINEYPVYEWYDLTLFSIAKIYYKQKMYARSIEALRNILFIDEDLVPKELVYLYFFRNAYQLRDTSEYFKKSLTIYFNLFKEYYQTSKFINEIYYFYSLYLIENGNIKEALTLLNYVASTDNVYKSEAIKLISKYK